MNGFVIAGLLATLFGALAVPAYADPPSITAPPDTDGIEAAGFFTSVNLSYPTVNVEPGLTHDVKNNAPSAFQVGNTTVTWLVKDSAGRQATDTQIVTILDTVPPKCPELEDLEYSVKLGKRVSVAFDLPSITDNADLHVDVTSSPESGSKFPIGNHTVTFTGTDDSGNSMDCPQNVLVSPTGIKNLSLTRTHNTITATWDLFENRTSYTLTLTNTEGEIEQQHKVRSNSHTFSDLESDEEYAVDVLVRGDKKITATARTTTFSPPFMITENFASVNGWTYGYEYDDDPPLPGSFNNYTFTIDPIVGSTSSPSAKISGDGENTASFIEKEFEMDNAYREGLFFSVDYKSGSTVEFYGAIVIGTEEKRFAHVKLLYMDPQLEWTTLDGKAEDLVDGDTLTVGLYLYDSNEADNGHTAYYDSLVLSTVPPPETFKAGSAGSSDSTPEQREFERVFYGILDGEIDPLEYTSGAKTVGQYDGLLEDILIYLHVISP